MVDDKTQKTSLTGVKPTDLPHLGNYLGAIRPALEFAGASRGICFIADYHALTTVRDTAALRTHTLDVAATWLASGLDPQQTIMFRQSDVPAVFELAWVLSCVIATGQLERGHSYKDALAKGEAPNAGIFYYPVLMAADILLYDADLVPVGKDQKQHLELARDMAHRVNHVFGDNTLVVPEPVISEGPLVPGLDGEKMSKSKGNSIPLFADAQALRKLVMKLVTGSETLEEPKTADGTTLFALYQLLASPAECTEMREKLARGGFGWGHAKEQLFQAIEREIGPKRERFLALRSNEKELWGILESGRDRAQKIATQTMARVRSRVGVNP